MIMFILGIATCLLINVVIAAAAWFFSDYDFLEKCGILTSTILVIIYGVFSFLSQPKIVFLSIKHPTFLVPKGNFKKMENWSDRDKKLFISTLKKHPQKMQIIAEAIKYDKLQKVEIESRKKSR